MGGPGLKARDVSLARAPIVNGRRTRGFYRDTRRACVLNRDAFPCHGRPLTTHGEQAAAAGAGAAALFGGLGVNPTIAQALAEAAGRSEKPLKAAFSNAGLQLA